MVKDNGVRPTPLANSVLREGDTRTPRAAEFGDRAGRDTREADARAKPWTPPSILPDPPALDGWVHRWVRTATLGNVDPSNVSMRFREGWEPCKASDYPELVQQVIRDHKSQFADGIEIGGLLLCRQPKELADQRRAYYENLAQQQTQSVDTMFMRQNDPRMPVLKPQVRTTVTRGRPDET